jgi:hypothetical protein
VANQFVAHQSGAATKVDDWPITPLHVMRKHIDERTG